MSLPTGVDWGLRLGELLSRDGQGAGARTFRYNGNGGADFNDLQAAIDACVDYRGDTIIVEQTENGAYGVDEVVEVNCPGITIKAAEIGMPPEGKGENVTFRGTAAVYADGPTLHITAPCHIKGLGFTTRNVSSADEESSAIQIEGTGGFSGGFVWLEECRFSAWYGAQSYGTYHIGSVMVRYERCTWDGLFGGFGIAGIGLDDNGTGTTPDFTHILECQFSGLGSGVPAVKLIGGATVKDLLMLRNINNNGFATRGVLLDNNSVVSAGLIADNYTGLANKAAAFLNLTNSNLSFQNNRYDE